MSGSHSAALTKRYSTLHFSLICVGKPAPPAPTTPALYIWSNKSILNPPYMILNESTIVHLLCLVNVLAFVIPSPVGPAMVNVVQPSPPKPIPA